jgi:hypothetical protein
LRCSTIELGRSISASVSALASLAWKYRPPVMVATWVRAASSRSWLRAPPPNPRGCPVRPPPNAPPAPIWSALHTNGAGSVVPKPIV